MPMHNTSVMFCFVLSRGLSLAAPVACGIALSACSVIGFGPELDQTSTTSIVKPVEGPVALAETVDPSDWDKVRMVMTTALVSQPAGAPLAWQNEITGTVGTIVPMDAATLPDGRLCRAFSTTLNGIGGVLQYRGDACARGDGNVELVDLAPHTAVVQAPPALKDTKIR
ncbi:MAG: hypothetical protein H2045_05445 [Rhizobiales bacterium]|nr:hypothetical protein [Hyphomicrobiales bacterium]